MCMFLDILNYFLKLVTIIMREDVLKMQESHLWQCKPGVTQGGGLACIVAE